MTAYISAYSTQISSGYERTRYVSVSGLSCGADPAPHAGGEARRGGGSAGGCGGSAVSGRRETSSGSARATHARQETRPGRHQGYL